MVRKKQNFVFLLYFALGKYYLCYWVINVGFVLFRMGELEYAYFNLGPESDFMKVLLLLIAINQTNHPF
jgi:hypothetical protein